MVWGQGAITSPPPVRSTVDANGVDLVTGLLTVSAPSLSIGQGEGALQYTRQLIGGAWTDNLVGTFSSASGVPTISFGGSSEAFNIQGTGYVNAQGGGSTLATSGTTATYTTASGVVVVFQQFPNGGGFPSYANQGRPVTATYPDGKIVTYTYRVVTVSGVQATRLQSVTNNFGYQLKLTYQLNTPATSADLTAWTTIASVIGINNAIDYCDPAADSCAGLTVAWPTVTFATVPGTASPTVNVTDPMGQVTTFTYPTGSFYLTPPGASSPTTLATLDASNRVVTLTNGSTTIGATGQGPGQWLYSYSSSSNVGTTVVSDPLGHTRTVVSNLTTSLPTSDTDALSRTTSYQYDSYGRLTQVTRPEGDYTVIAYDGRGNVTSSTTYPSSGSGSIQTTANYDSTCTSPAKCNQPNWTKDALLNETDYTYNATTGQVATVTAPAPVSGSPRPQSRFSYTSTQAYYKNSAGSIVASGAPVSLLTGTSSCATTSSCTGTSDEVVSGISYGSTGVANNLGVTSASAGPGNGAALTTSSQTYDAFGNVATTVGALGASQTTVYFYNANRQPTGIIAPLAAGASAYPATRYSYNAAGQTTMIEQGTTPNQGGLSSFTSVTQQTIGYDAVGRQSTVAAAGGGTTTSFAQYTYDNANRLTCTALRMNTATFSSPPASACVQGTPGSNGSDRITLNTYDAADELTQMTTGYLTPAQANYATTTYTANGYVATVKDAMNNLTTVVRDGYDRPTQIQFPSPTQGSGSSNTSDYESYGYDANGNLTSKRLRNGDSVTFTFDALNRPTLEHFVSGASRDVSWSYDLLGRTLSTTWSSATGPGVSYTYDALGRVLTSSAGGRTLTYAYDAAGNRTRMTFPDTGANTLYLGYAHDALNDLTQVQENGATSGVGLLANYVFDSLGRRTALSRAGGAGAATAYAYDSSSRLQTLTQTLAGSASVTYTFGYNAANQIVTRQVSNDAYTAHPGALSYVYATNGLNQYGTVTGVAAPAAGNLGAAMTYDPLGRLQSSTANGTTTNFLYDGDALVGEYNPSGGIVARYATAGPGADEPLVWYQGGGTATRSWLGADNLGSIVLRSDSGGNSQATYAYGPYGEPITSAGAPAWGDSRYRYTGQIEIPEAQFYYYKARAYDPATGRFLQTDPVGLQSDVNFYAYAVEDPVNESDASGTGDPDDVQPGFPAGSAGTTFTDSSGNSWTLDGRGGAFLNGDLNVNGGTNTFDQIFQLVALKSISAQNIQVNAGPDFKGLRLSTDTPRVTCSFNATFTAVGPNQAHANGALYSAYPTQAGGSIKGGTFGTVAVQNGFLGLSTRQLRGYGTQIQIIPSNQNLISAFNGPLGPLTISDYGDANVQANHGPAFDIYRFPTNRDALGFGRRTMNVTVSFPAASGGRCP
jgi:RHS repeat-associated protein